MSELKLLILRGRKWPIGCQSFVRECRHYCLLSERGSNSGIRESTLKLQRIVAILSTEKTISRPLTWWSSVKALLPQNQECTTEERSPRTASVPVVSLESESLSRIKIDKDAAASKLVYKEEKQAPENSTAISLYLQQLLDVSPDDADYWVLTYRGFSIIDPEDISLNYRTCLKAGLTNNTIKECPQLLAYPNNILEQKVQMVSKIALDDINDTVPFLLLSITKLRVISYKLKYETVENDGINRITFLTQQLKCPTIKVTKVVAKHHFMQTVSFSKLKQVMKILLDCHVSREDILNDVWTFRYNPEIIQDRLQRAVDAGVFPVKTWMIRCPEVTLTRRIQKEFRQRSVLGEKGTISQYIMDRFKCNSNELLAMKAKCPKIMQVSGPKTKQILDFLLENEYTAQHMVRTPQVLFRRLETMQKRLVELQQYDHKPISLIVFCKSKKEYNTYLEMIKLRWKINKEKASQSA